MKPSASEWERCVTDNGKQLPLHKCRAYREALQKSGTKLRPLMNVVEVTADHLKTVPDELTVEFVKPGFTSEVIILRRMNPGDGKWAWQHKMDEPLLYHCDGVFHFLDTPAVEVWFDPFLAEFVGEEGTTVSITE